MTIKSQQKNNSIATIGERIKHVRKLRKLSQAELGEILGLTQGFIGHIESGRNQPSIKFVERMAKAVNCNTMWLATGSGNVENDPDYVITYSDNIHVGEIKPVYSKHESLKEMLTRILKEGDETKLAAVRGVLTSLDPGKNIEIKSKRGED